MDDGARWPVCRSLAAKAVLLLAAGATVLWVGWDHAAGPVPDPRPARVAGPAGVPPARAADTRTPPAAATARLDVNLASVEELTGLPGIGPVLAERIASHREKFGPYTSLDALLDVRGIGPVRLSRLRSSLTFSEDPRRASPASGRAAPPRKGPRS